VDRARTSNPATLGPKIDRIILAREPDAVFQRRRAATVEREVVITSFADGMVEIWGRLPGQDGVLLDSRLDQVARTVCPADPRSHAARRADALTCLVTDTAMTCGCGCQGSTPLPAHRRPQVIVSAATLLGVTQDPAELVGYGPIDPDLAGELAADADWVRPSPTPAPAHSRSCSPTPIPPAPPWPGWCACGTAPAASPGAPSRRVVAISITVSRWITAIPPAGVPPRRTTCSRCAAITTAPRPSGCGHTPTPGAPLWNGPARLAPRTPRGPPTTAAAHPPRTIRRCADDSPPEDDSPLR